MKLIKLKLTDLILRSEQSERLEGWTLARSRLPPSFETPATRAPQDDVDGIATLALRPHGPHLCSNARRCDGCLRGARNRRVRSWPGTAGEVLRDRTWNEARTLGMDMPVARAA